MVDCPNPPHSSINGSIAQFSQVEIMLNTIAHQSDDDKPVEPPIELWCWLVQSSISVVFKLMILNDDFIEWGFDTIGAGTNKLVQVLTNLCRRKQIGAGAI